MLGTTQPEALLDPKLLDLTSLALQVSRCREVIDRVTTTLGYADLSAMHPENPGFHNEVLRSLRRLSMTLEAKGQPELAMKLQLLAASDCEPIGENTLAETRKYATTITQITGQNPMKEKPHLGILNRDEAAIHIRQHFFPTVELLRSVTNYGIDLITLCSVSSDGTPADLVVIRVLLRQVVAMLDAVEVLISKGAVYATHLNARALFEASLAIDWILQKDTDNRARHYYVSKLRRDRIWAARTQSDAAEAQDFEDDIPFAERPELQEAGKQQLEQIDRLLALPAYSSINEAFDKIRGEGKLEPNWYRPLGVRNLQEMSAAVGREQSYRVFYDIASEAMHGENFGRHVSVNPGTLVIEPIRQLAGIRPLLIFVLSTTFHTYETILTKYRAGEEPAFIRS